MAGGDLQEAWRCLKGWYRDAGEHSPKPCYESMDKQTRERVELYGMVPPLGITYQSTLNLSRYGMMSRMM